MMWQNVRERGGRRNKTKELQRCGIKGTGEMEEQDTGVKEVIKTMRERGNGEKQTEQDVLLEVEWGFQENY